MPHSIVHSFIIPDPVLCRTTRPGSCNYKQALDTQEVVSFMSSEHEISSWGNEYNTYTYYIILLFTLLYYVCCPQNPALTPMLLSFSYWWHGWSAICCCRTWENVLLWVYHIVIWCYLVLQVLDANSHWKAITHRIDIITILGKSLNYRSYITGWWFSHPSEKYEFVNWDDEIPNIWENKNGNQTTNQ